MFLFSRFLVGVANDILRIIRDFLWSWSGGNKKDHLVRWKVCCKPKNEGRLGLGNLVSKNIAVVAKWLWQFPLALYS